VLDVKVEHTTLSPEEGATKCKALTDLWMLFKNKD